MSKTAWIWVISIGLGLAVVICSIRAGNYIGNWMKSRKIIGHPPNEYADLFKGQDDRNLQFLETVVDRYRNPVSRYRYHGKYQILVTWLNFSDTGRLQNKLNIIRAEIPGMGLTDSYDQLNVGAIDVNFHNLDQPDSSFGKVTLTIEGRGFENNLANDTILSYFLQKGYFSISRSPGEVPDIFSGKGVDHYWPGSSTPTVLLFISRGNYVFILVGSANGEKTEVPPDLLLRLVSEKS
jgi:hypothetical protein